MHCVFVRVGKQNANNLRIAAFLSAFAWRIVLQKSPLPTHRCLFFCVCLRAAPCPRCVG